MKRNAGIFTAVFSFALATAAFGQDVWIPQTSGTSQALNLVQFIDANTGWAVGAGGTILKTVNAGTTWSAQTSGTSVELSSLRFVDANTGWAVGGGGTLLQTTNGGTNWNAQSSGRTTNLWSVHFLDANTGWISGANAIIIKSTNGGTSWSQQNGGNSITLAAIQFVDASIGYSVGDLGNIGKSSNGGASWAQQPSGTSQFLISLHFIDATTGWTVGYGGTIKKTINGGSTWTTQTSGTTVALYSVRFADANTGWAVGSSGTILKTINGGTTWTAQTSGTSQFLYSVYCTDANNAWIVGGGGTVLKLNAAPAGLSYAANPAAYATGLAITPNIPSVSGTVSRYSVSPALPAGLSLDTLTGIISGTPAVPTAAANYVVTATNGLGSTTVALNISVQTAPSGLSYSANPAAYLVGTAITANNPTVTGTVTGYTVSPALPGGLSLDAITGVITGTPTTVTPTSSYTVRAYNGGVFTTVVLNIGVTGPPSGLSYSSNPAVYGAGVAIVPNNPTVTGTVPIAYSVSPALPAGLNLNAATGTISGTPAAPSASAYYVVTATNGLGSTSISLGVSVITAPAGLVYSINSAQYVVGAPITPNNPTVTGTVSNYTISPPLPTGLLLNSTTGIISGTPLYTSAAANYTITAANVAGSTTATVGITVLLSPSNLSYTTNNVVYTVNAPIPPNTPSLSGSSPLTYSVNPVLPTGLTLNTTSGGITGTPTVVTPAASYTVTATNPVGFTTVTLTITVNIPSAVSRLDASHAFAVRIQGSAPFLFPLPGAAVQYIQVLLLDIHGNAVWAASSDLGGGRELSWEGKPADGRSLSSGVYFLRVRMFGSRHIFLASATKQIAYVPQSL